MYADAAQYNEPPRYPVNVVCGAIDAAPEGTDILGKIFAGVVAYMGNQSCYDMGGFGSPTQSYDTWTWQVAFSFLMNYNVTIYKSLLKEIKRMVMRIMNFIQENDT